MSEQLILNAEKRERAGKGASRAVRREGKVPGVIYGGKAAPEIVMFATRDISKAWHTGVFLRELCHIDVEGKKTRVIPREVQVHPVTDVPLHVDFLRLEKGSRLNIEVEVHFIGQEESPGLTRGGALNVVRYTVELNVPVDEIPEFIEADVSELDIGGSVHISAIKLPDGVRPTITGRDFTVATIAAQISEEVVVDEDAEEGIEGEEGVEGAEGSEEEAGEDKSE